MLSIAPVIGSILLISVIAVILVIFTQYKKKTGTFQTSIMDKYVRNTVIYSGIFIPIVFYVLIVDMGIEIRVNKQQYDRIQIGESVYVSLYSNGSYQLE